jgi:hypothetical protein
MVIRLLLAFCLAFMIIGDYVPIHERIQDSGNNADFTYHSHVENISDNKMRIVNYIKNNSADTPLSIQWDDGGILCTGFYQIKPGATQDKKSIAQEPYAFDHSVMKYGNALQYSTEGRCYVDGQARQQAKAQTIVSEYERQDESGTKLFRIEVASTLNEDTRSASISFRIVGGSNLILPSRIGTEIKGFSNIQGDGRWELTKTNSLNEISMKDELDRKVSVEWLNRTPKLKSMGTGSDFVVLKNRVRGSNEIMLPITGVNWGVERVYLIAFMPNQSGVFGLTADVFLPR